MRHSFLGITLLLGLTTRSQQFFESYNGKQFEEIRTNGIVYVLTGDEHLDSLYIESLENYWKSCPFEIFDRSAGKTLAENRVVLYETDDQYIGRVVGLCSAKYFEPEIKTHKSLGYVSYSGFSNQSGKSTRDVFQPYVVSTLDAVVGYINADKMITTNDNIRGKLYDGFITKSATLKSKTLLIPAGIKTRIDTTGLSALKIPYEVKNALEIAEMTDSEKSDYCLFYFDLDGWYSTCMIFDMETRDLIYFKGWSDTEKLPPQKFSKNHMSAMIERW
jgi:hypothetical protein